MPKIRYQWVKFKPESVALISQANEIIETYTAQGLDLTLRQLYYQFVSRALIPNKDTEYKRLGSIISDARLAGLIDWNAITDRTRHLRGLSSWSDPEEIIRSAAHGYRIDKWDVIYQHFMPEVWIEKDALVGVIERPCNEHQVNYFSCRGYTSQTEMWGASQRLLRYIEAGQTPVILHLGDHDPSGKDMSRDIEDRLRLFVGEPVEIKRLALNMDQIETYAPPPNPAKITDSRAAAYIAEFGDESWELDALEPTVMSDLVAKAILELRDQYGWHEALQREELERAALASASAHWDKVANFVADLALS